jgi:hypothetical protein
MVGGSYGWRWLVLAMVGAVPPWERGNNYHSFFMALLLFNI